MDTSLTKLPKRSADNRKTQTELESLDSKETGELGLLDSIKETAGAVVQPVVKKISDWASSPAVQTQLGEWKANLSTMIPTGRQPSDIMQPSFDNLPVQEMKVASPTANVRPSWADQPNLPKIRQDALKAWEADNTVDTTQWMKDNSDKYRTAPMTPEERERKRKAYEAMSRGTAEL